MDAAYRTAKRRKAIAMKSSALKGTTPAKFVSPFYDTARRFIGISPAIVDAYLKARATARIDHNIVTLEDPQGRQHTASFHSIHRGKIAAWVNKFNDKSGEK